MKRLFKKLIKILGVILALLLALIVALLLVVQLPFVKQRILDRGLGIANDALIGRVDVGRLEGDLITGARLRDITVFDARDRLVARIGVAEAQYRLAPLLRGQLIIDVVEVEDILAVVRRYEDEIWNFSLIAEESDEVTEPGDFPIFIDQIELRRSLILYADEADSRPADLEGQRQAVVDLLENRGPAGPLSDLSTSAIREHLVPVLAPRPALDEEHEPFVPPAAGLIDGLELDASFAMLGGQSLQVELLRFETVAHLDSIAREISLASQPLKAYYAPDAVRVDHGGMRINGESGWSGLELEATFETIEDAYGNRSPERIRAIAATWSGLRIDRTLIGRVAPDLPLSTGAELTARLAGDHERLRLVASLQTLDAPGELDIAADVRPELDGEDLPSFSVSIRASDLVPHRYWDLGPSEVSLGAEIFVEGRGDSPENLEASTRIALIDLAVDEYRGELIYGEARYDRGFVEVRPLGVLTPYLDLFAAGIFDPSGTFTATLRTTADADQSARAADLAPVRPAQADLTLDLAGSFDPEIEPFQDALQQVQLTGAWDFRGFEAEDIRVGASQGTIDSGVVRREDPAGTRYDADFRVNGQGRALSATDLRLAALEATGRGQGQIVLPIEDPLLALRRLDTSWDARVTGMRTADLAVTNGRLQGRIQKTPDRARRIQYDVAAMLAGLRATDALQMAMLRTDLTGYVTVDLDADGLDMIDDLRVRGSLSGQELDTDALRAQEITTAVDLTGPPANLRGGIEARLDNLHLDTLEMDLAAFIARLELSPTRNFALEATALRPQETIPVARLDAAGLYYEDLAGAELTTLAFGTDRMLWTMQEPGRLTARAEAVRFENVRLTHQDQLISLHGIFRPGQSQDLELALAGILLEELRQGFYLEAMMPPVEGRLDMATTLTGTEQRPRLRMAAQLAEFHADGQGPFGVDLQMSYADDALRLETLNVSAFERPVLDASMTLPVRVTLDGDTRVFWERPLDGRVRLLPFEFTDFNRAIPWLDDHGVEGSAAGQLAMQGTVARPNIDLTMTVEDFAFQGEIGDDFVDLRELNWKADLTYEPVVGRQGGFSFDTQVDWHGERLFSATAAAPLPLARWLQQSVEGEEPDFDWDSDLLTLPMRLNVQVPGLALERIPLESAREMSLDGRLMVDVDLQGTINDPQGRINLGLHTFGFDRYRDIYIDVNATVANRFLELERMRLEWDADEILAAQGTIPLPLQALLEGAEVQDLPGQFALQLREIPISKLSAIDYTFARIRGSVAAYLTFDGTLRNPSFEGRFGLFNTELGDRRLGTIAASIQGSNNLIEANGTFCREYDTLATAEAELPVLLDIIELVRGANPLLEGPIRMVARGEKLDLGDVLPTRLIEAWITDPDGDLDFFAQVTGTWEEPAATGHLTLEEGALTLPRFGRRFEDIETRLALDDDNLHIRRFSLRDGPSSLSMEGTVLHRLMVPQRAMLTAEARDFNLVGIATEFPVYVSANVESWADLEATPQNVGVNIDALEVVLTDFGDRDFHPTDIHQDIMVLRRNAQRTVRDPRDLAELTAMREAATDVLNMRVDVNVARNSWLRHPNGDVNIEANVTADLLGDVVTLTGSGQAIRGEFEFLGRRFVVQESVITFTGAVPPNPILQIEATHPMDRAVINALGPPSEGEPRIIIRVAGTASQPRLELMSDPAMTDTEILFVLMTGRPPDRRDGGQEEGVATRALGAVSGLFFGMLQDRLAGSIPVDVLRLEAGARGFAGGRLEVGKYITSDLFLAYRHQFGADEEVAANIVRGEYHFLPRSMLELIYTDRNEVSLNVFWDIY